MYERREKEQGEVKGGWRLERRKGEALSLLQALMEPRGEENSLTIKRWEERREKLLGLLLVQDTSSILLKRMSPVIRSYDSDSTITLKEKIINC
jgi:hypothetical protein